VINRVPRVPGVLSPAQTAFAKLKAQRRGHRNTRTGDNLRNGLRVISKPKRPYRLHPKDQSHLHPLLRSLGIKPRRGVVLVCVRCGKEVYRRRAQAIHKNTYCSRDCRVVDQKAKAFSLDCIICGTKFYTQPAQVKYRNRQGCSVKCRGIAATRKAEERNRLTPPSIGKLNRRIRYSKRMDQWRRAIFERDQYTCQDCGKKGGYLEADHIKPFAKFPELRFELSNGRTLCRPCHMKTPTWGYRTRIAA
jgi:hypothetical protein